MQVHHSAHPSQNTLSCIKTLGKDAAITMQTTIRIISMEL